MGREIKFRGKPIEDYGDIKWFYGSLILNHDDKLAYIEAPYQGTVPVEWESVGQYTGLKDKNGTEICEGDIADVCYMGFTRFRVNIVLGEYEQDGSGGEYEGTKCIGFYAKALNPAALDNDECRIVPEYIRETSILSFDSIEIIGNIYENPELLESH